MNTRLWILSLLLLLLAAPATAARIYAIDPETGQTTVTDTAPEKELLPEAKPATGESDLCQKEKAEIQRLQAIVLRQQRILQRQQTTISQQRQELRKKDNVIQGLDLLRRQGR